MSIHRNVNILSVLFLLIATSSLIFTSPMAEKNGSEGEHTGGLEMIRVDKEHFPALRLIGKCYTDSDRGVDGGFGTAWAEWFEKGWFDELEALGPLQDIEQGQLGCMSSSNEGFRYWIGMFFPENTPVPEGFAFADIPEGEVGLCWIYGNPDTDNMYTLHDTCMKKLREQGMGEFRDDFAGELNSWYWFFERYNHPRFTTPDENGKVILDYGIYLSS